METTDFGDRDDRRYGPSGHRSVIRGVFLEPEVRSGPMVVLDVGREDATEMRLVDDDHVIETLASDGADQALDERIGVSRRLHRQRVVRRKPFASPIPSIRCVGVRFD